MQRFRGSGIGALVLALIALGVVVAGCGGGGSSSGSSSSSGSGSSTGGGSSSAGVAQAEAEVAKYLGAGEKLSVPPLSEKPKAGVKVAYVNCTLPGCQTETVEEAAKALGWNLKFFPYNEGSPESYVNAFKSAVAYEPEALGFDGTLPNELIATQLEELSAEGVPISAAAASSGGIEESKFGVDSCFLCAPQFEADGKLMADIVAADAGGPTTIGFVSDPALDKSIFGPVIEGFNSELEATIPGSKVEHVDIQAAGSASQNAAAVVSYVSSHPEAKYLVVAVADFEAGLPQALAQAGLSGQVKVVTRLLQPPNVGEIEEGKLFAGVASEDQAAFWRQMDALARGVIGQKIPEPEPAGWRRVVDSSNAEPDMSLEPPEYQQAFEQAWQGK